MTDRRFEIGVLVGPCSEAECEALMEAILDLPEATAVGGVASCGPWREDDESDPEASAAVVERVSAYTGTRT